MADGGLTLEIDQALAEKVKAAAAAAGVSVETFLRDALEQHLSAGTDWSDDPDSAIDERIVDEMVERGDGIPWEIFQERFRSFGRRGA